MSTLIIPKKEAEQIVNEDHDDWEMIKETIKNQSRWSTHFFRSIQKHHNRKIL